MSIRVILGDVREKLAELPNESVHCVVTSPPYFGLRDYGTASWEGGDPACDHSPEKRGGRFATPVSGKQASNAGSGTASQRDCPCGATRTDKQIGLEPTPAEFVTVMVEVFREIRRVLRKDGTLWLNLGDSYARQGGTQGGGNRELLHLEGKQRRMTVLVGGLKEKDLLGIPWRVAFALQADGWYLRQDIIWSKPNPMPESVTDRCTKAHEYLFLLSKSARYHYDAEAIKEQAIGPAGGNTKPPKSFEHDPVKHATKGGLYKAQEKARQNGGFETRNKRSVWEVSTQSFQEAHFATFPPDLIEPCIKAGCPKDCCAKCGAPVVRDTERVDQGYDGSAYGERAIAATGFDLPESAWRKSTLGSSGGKLTGKTKTLGFSPSCACDAGLVRGTVLDPFGGAGTTGLVADRLQRDAILIELNPEYMAMAEERIKDDAPLFAVLT